MQTTVEKRCSARCSHGVSGGGGLDKLAQPRQSPESGNLRGGENPGVPDREAIQNGLQKRARSKWLTQAVVWPLVKLRSELEQSYVNTVYCANAVFQQDGTMQSRYCGNRWCLVCNRIRIAKAINVYKPILEEWDDPQFVTLTVRNCSGEKLSEVMDQMLKDFNSCKLSIRRTEEREFKALRKLECTYSRERRDFHPHYHVVVEGREVADMLVTKWLERHRASAERAGQDVRACDGDTLMELFKYFTKLITKAQDGGREVMPPRALDTIFQAMRRRRTYQPVGFWINRKDREETEDGELELDGTPAIKQIATTVTWWWEQELHDWVDVQTGELLSEYEPTEAFRRLVEDAGGIDGAEHVEDGRRRAQRPLVASQAGDGW